MEKQLHEGDALDVLRLDVMNPRDVQKVILVVVGQEPFHLGGIHAAVRLGHINDGRVEVRENVYRHTSRRQVGPYPVGKEIRQRKERADKDSRNGHHHGERPPHRENDRIHLEEPFGLIVRLLSC